MKQNTYISKKIWNQQGVKELLLWMVGALLVSSILGVLLRWYFIWPVEGLDYRNILHSHSHIALLGWISPVCMFMMALTVGWENSSMRIAFHSIGVVSILMGLSFLLYGYNVLSISLSVVHTALSLYVVLNLWKVSSTEHKLLNIALVWYLISTVSVLFVGPFKAIFGGNSTLYLLSIQFFLHTIFNAWLVYAILYLFVWWLDNNGMHLVTPKYFNSYMNLGILLSFSLQIHWLVPNTIFYFLNILGVVLQLIAYRFLITVVLRLKTRFRENKYIYLSLISVVISLSLKLFSWVITAIPVVADDLISIRHAAIAFFHLNALGFSTLSVVSLLFGTQVLPFNKWTLAALYIFITAFILKEAFLLIQTVLLYLELGFIPYFYHILMYSAILFPISIGLFFIHLLKSSSKKPYLILN